MNTTLPQAGPREGAAGRSFGSQAFDGGVSQLATFLEGDGATARWDLVTTSAQQASTLIADYGLSVMALGGFSGNDPTITVDQFADYVAEGDVRYVLANGGGGGFMNFGAAGGFGGNTPRQPAGGQNRSFPGSNQAPGQPASAQPPGADAKGANVVMSAVRAVCTPVSGASAPAEYSGSLYDCDGAAGQLHDYN